MTCIEIIQTPGSQIYIGDGHVMITLEVRLFETDDVLVRGLGVSDSQL